MVPDISLIEVMQSLSDGNVNSTVIINDVEKFAIQFSINPKLSIILVVTECLIMSEARIQP